MDDEEDVPELDPLYRWCEHLLDLPFFELYNIVQFVPEIAHVMWTCRRLRALVRAQMEADMQQLRLTEPELLASIPEKSDQFRWYAETWRSGAEVPDTDVEELEREHGKLQEEVRELKKEHDERLRRRQLEAERLIPEERKKLELAQQRRERAERADAAAGEIVEDFRRWRQQEEAERRWLEAERRRQQEAERRWRQQQERQRRRQEEEEERQRRQQRRRQEEAERQRQWREEQRRAPLPGIAELPSAPPPPKSAEYLERKKKEAAEAAAAEEEQLLSEERKELELARQRRERAQRAAAAAEPAAAPATAPPRAAPPARSNKKCKGKAKARRTEQELSHEAYVSAAEKAARARYFELRQEVEHAARLEREAAKRVKALEEKQKRRQKEEAEREQQLPAEHATLADHISDAIARDFDRTDDDAGLQGAILQSLADEQGARNGAGTSINPPVEHESSPSSSLSDDVGDDYLPGGVPEKPRKGKERM